ncbi:MAG: bifunctional folylpolyglutamate synthase/dihydrofolate synthase [Candidatus Omnitrophica bacterium]|nr:bifunctional folylpolyglutamate synthase/dihydrofolate synthase [Candidatus Omnitrophota bacterium]MDD5574159.1 bifunctional folylpolyglutamate synthase/dihydrofolate synthase [Candidatus Omnitrophota bacterium]
MTYDNALAYLEKLVNYERKPVEGYRTVFKLERVAAFLETIGNPQHRLRIVHVAGTKGKGSTSCFIAQILRQAGYRTGLYTSPHLQDIRERIRILDPHAAAEEHASFPGMILKNDFTRLLEDLTAPLELFGREAGRYGSLTFFEVLTAMALKYFADKKTEAVVLETGLGGRLDATNAASALLSVITPVSYDHEYILGRTLPEIAFEKAGIIKSSNVKTKDGLGICVSSLQMKEAAQVIRRRCGCEGAMLLEMGKDFCFKKLTDDLLSQNFFYKGIDGSSHFFDIRMLGEHQLINASVALAAVEALGLHGIRVPVEAMAQGLKTADWPGRLEMVSTRPFVILDGAHNRESAHRLAAFVEKEFDGFRKWLVFGASTDKDIKGLADLLGAMADRVILTKSRHPRAADPEKHLRGFFRKAPFLVTGSVEEAMDLLKKQMQPEEVAVVTGSLFVVGEARALWQR